MLKRFDNYSWPGNVRELRNTLERAVIVCEGSVIETKHLPPGFGQTTVAHSQRTIPMPCAWVWEPRWKKPKSC